MIAIGCEIPTRHIALRTEGFSAEADGHTFMAIIVVDVLW
jgi:hypothetical protein